MRRALFSLASVLVVAVCARAQDFNLPGGGIANTGIQPFSSTTSTRTYTNSGTAVNRAHSDPQGPVEYEYHETPEAKAARKRYEHDTQVFHKIGLKGYTVEAMNDWLSMAQQAGYTQAYFNYAATAWQLGNLRAARDGFNWLQQTGCKGIAAPWLGSDTQLCNDARTCEASVINELGIEALKAGDYRMAEAWFRREVEMTGDFCNYVDRNSGETTHCDLTVSYFNLALALHSQGRWEDANYAARQAWGAALAVGKTWSSATEGDGWYGCHPVCHDASPYLNRSIELVHTTHEDMDYASALKIIQSGGDMHEAQVDLGNAMYYDSYTADTAPTERKSYNARAIWATMLHRQGNDVLAEENADIVLLQHPGDPTAQLLLDTIHKKDLDEMQLHASTAGGDYHWPNQCNQIIDPHINGYNLHCVK